MISERLLSMVVCPTCQSALARRDDALVCIVNQHRYATAGDYLDLRPADAFSEQTKYLDEALHADGRQEAVSPPLLSAAIRNDMLRRFLQLGPGDRAVDLGCGSGRVLLWNQDLGAYQIGVDVSPFFAAEARAAVDLALADLRSLPFTTGTFTKAWALDVLEHLSPQALDLMLAEASRVLTRGGQLFAYSHVRKNSPVALGLKAVNRVARWLDRAGAIDLTHERLRKSDHLNPLADIPALEAAAARAGFRVARIRYYTPLVGAVVENILLRLAERWMASRVGATSGARGASSTTPQSAARDDAARAHVESKAVARAARREAKAWIAQRGAVYWGLRGLTWCMKLDLLLFGRVRSGPFFVLLEKI